jgi:hypothetical protein
VLVQSAGIVLIEALLGWAIISLLQDCPVAKLRFKLVAPVTLVALLVQISWLHRGSNPRGWPMVPCRGESYLSQLKVKNGNYPELGLASPKDLVLRVGHNLKERTLYLNEVLIRRWISPSWASDASFWSSSVFGVRYCGPTRNSALCISSGMSVSIFCGLGHLRRRGSLCQYFPLPFLRG